MALDDDDLEYWERVAEDGDVAAMRYVAFELREIDRPRSLKWFKKAAEAGDSLAAFWLGYLLHTSNPTDAARWYRLAAEAGHVGAMSNLGQLLRNTDRKEARRWLEQAALRDNARAMAALGQLLASSRPRESLRWSRLAAEKGDQYGMVQWASWLGLRRMFARGKARQRFSDESFELMLKAAELNNTRAMWNLSFRHGASEEERRRWLQAAADNGDRLAERILIEGPTFRNLLRLLRIGRRQDR